MPLTELPEATESPNTAEPSKPYRPDMTPAQARTCVEHITGHIEAARLLVHDLYERKGWKALGYETWAECVTTEFAQSRSQVYRQLKAARIQIELTELLDSGTTDATHVRAECRPMGDKQTLMGSPDYADPAEANERTLRPLAQVPEGSRVPVWAQASQAAQGMPTAKLVQQMVDEHLAPQPVIQPPEEDEEEDTHEETHEPGITIVNGVTVDHDPPDIANLRANGKIPHGVKVEIFDPGETTTVESVEEDIEEDAAMIDSMSDDDWVQTMPLYKTLQGINRQFFEHSAIAWRELRAARMSFQLKVAAILKPHGRWGEPYRYKVDKFLRIKDPRYWALCPPTHDGGCGGIGAVSLIGKCNKCNGKGFWIR